MKSILLELLFFLGRVLLLVFAVAIAGGFQIIDCQFRMHGFPYLREKINLVQIGLVLSEGLHYCYFDYPIRSWQRSDVEDLLSTLLLEGQPAPQHHFITNTGGYLDLDGLRVGGVIMPAMEANPRNLRVVMLNFLETDSDELWQSRSAVPYFLPSITLTSSLSSSTWLGWCIPSLLYEECAITFAPSVRRARLVRLIAKNDLNYDIIGGMKSKFLLKLPSQLNLGTVLPGQYGEIALPLKCSSVAFLNLELSKRSIEMGYFLLREGTNDCKNQLSLVVKPGTTTNIIVASYPQQVSKSTTHHGELYISEEGNTHTIRLVYKIELPRILCKKMLESVEGKERMIRIIINKAVTNEGRIMLTNQEDYPLQIQPALLVNHTIANTDSPFILKANSTVLQVQPKQQFIIFLTLSTNIGFKQQFKGMKRCVLRNVLTLKTNSILIWCLPIEILVIFVKQPEMKE